MRSDPHAGISDDNMTRRVASDWALLRRLLKYLYPSRWIAAVGLLLLLVAKGIEAWIPLQLGSLVQYLLHVEFDKASAFLNVKTALIMLIGWAAASYLFDVANIIIKNWVGQKALLTLRTEVYKHIQHLPLSNYDRTPVGRLITRTIHDVDQLSQLFSESTIPIIGSLFLFFSIFIALFFIDWKIGVSMALVAPWIWYFTHCFRYYQRRCYDQLRSMIAGMNSFIQEHLMGISIIRYFSLQAQEKKRFDQLNQDQLSTNLDLVHHFSLFFSGIDILQNVIMITVFVLLVAFLPEGAPFDAGAYFTINLYGLMVFRPLVDLAERYNILQAGMAAAARIFDVLDQPLEPIGASPGLPLHAIETVQFDDVWFAYQDDHWVLKGVSFEIHRKESVAFVGLTGAGKTSIMNLLLRFYEFQKGRILINGEEIHSYAVADVRRAIGVILQDPAIFSGTVSANIALYDPAIGEPQVEQAAHDVNLMPRLALLSGGLQSVLKEMGKSLSVGEMQLVSLARALAHQRDFLIFDEATANIDTPTERVIQDALHRMFKRKTLFIIAHRLSTIRYVDRIFVLDRGELAESGSHEELLALKGIYAKLYKLQSS